MNSSAELTNVESIMSSRQIKVISRRWWANSVLWLQWQRHSSIESVTHKLVPCDDCGQPDHQWCTLWMSLMSREYSTTHSLSTQCNLFQILQHTTPSLCLSDTDKQVHHSAVIKSSRIPNEITKYTVLK